MRAILKTAGYFCVAVLFAIAYAQAPLFTSNQNQYFLHGLAANGWGLLENDWLANTLDPTPLFSLLVGLSYRWLGANWVYYLYYTILLGIYLYCLVGIVNAIYPVRKSPASTLLFVAGLFLVHSAGLRFALSRLLGDNWSYLLEDGLADQRLLGPVFQPSAFGVLLLLSIYLFLRQRPYLAVLSAALAATFHPTYLLSAACLTVAYMLSSFQERRRLGEPLAIGLVALLAVAPILYYTFTNFANTPPETTARAQDILVNFRIPHHALASWWFDATAVIKIGLVAAALYLVRRSRLFLILLTPALAALLLTLIQLFSHSNALALLFPWRVSTFLVPLATALLLGWGVTSLVSTLEQRPDKELKYQKWIAWLSLGIIAAASLVGAIRMRLDFARQALEAERPAAEFAASRLSPGQTYLIPTKMQEFRLESGAPAYVDFKAIPYRDSDVLEWYERIQLADRFFKEGDCTALAQITAEGRVTHVILPTDWPGKECAGMQLEYQDQNYRVVFLK